LEKKAMPTSKANGSQTATIGTEHSLLNTTDAGTYVLKLDISAMQAGDVLELRGKSKARSADSLQIAYFQSFENAPDTENTLTVSVPVYTDGATVEFTLKQTFGTGRAYPWNVLSL